MRTTAILILLWLILPFPIAFGQTEGDPIRLKKVFGGYKFYQNDHQLTIRQLRDAVGENLQAYKEIESARRTRIWVLILSGLGGAMIGDQVGTSMAGGDPDWSVAVAGGGLVFVAMVPLNNKFNREARRGVDLYNAELGADVQIEAGTTQPPPREKANFSFGFGIPEILNTGVRYQLEQAQLGLYIGSWPWGMEYGAIRTISADVRYHFGGSSKLSQRRPWYWKIGLDYLRDTWAGRYYQSEEHFYLLNTRIGRDFNISENVGLNLGVGIMVCLGQKYVSRKSVKRGCDDVLLPSLGLGFYIRV